MTTYARIANGIVAELVEIGAGEAPLAERYHPDLLPEFIELTDAQAQQAVLGWVYADGQFSEPPPPPLVQTPEITWKADIWRRCTDAEAETLRGLINGASARQQGLWNDSTYLDSSDPDFDFVRQAAVGAFGEERAAELLAPSA